MFGHLSIVPFRTVSRWHPVDRRIPNSGPAFKPHCAISSALTAVPSIASAVPISSLCPYTAKKFRFMYSQKMICALPQSQFPHSCVCERFIYSQDRSTYFFAAEYADRSGEYINRTQKHECKNWDYGRAVHFLGIYVSNFRYSIFAVNYAYL
jgi:hypothetical protein